MTMTTQAQLAPVVHLETIYEESDHSQSSSLIDKHPHSSSIRRKFSPSRRFDGLISARSIPTVDTHRRSKTHEKPPIEVRFRDGSKRFIHPLSSGISSGLSSVNKSSTDSKKKINGKYRQGTTTKLKKKSKNLPKKPEIVLTIITAAELRQAGMTPPSTSSPDESETVTITKSASNSSIDTLHTINDVSFKENHEVSLRQPMEEKSLSRPAQKPLSVHSENPPRTVPLIPPVAVIPPNLKRTMPSLQITLTNEENEKNSTLNRSETTTTKTLTVSNSNETTIQSNPRASIPSTGKILVGGGSRSAFRPFLKQPSTNPSNYVKPTVIADRHSQRQPAPSNIFSSSNISSLNQLPLQPSTTLIPPPIHRDVRAISSERPQMKLSDNSNSIVPPSTVYNEPISPGGNLPGIVDPTLQWHSITSKSLYDVPRLSKKYADKPLRITIPVKTPNHNQKYVQKHNPVLERRLFDAGLSPETVALYERILEVADTPFKSTPELFPQ